MRFIYRIHMSPRFEKEFDNLPQRIQELARQKDKLFRKDAFIPRLRRTNYMAG